MIFKKMIFTGFSPNLTLRDVRIALTYLCLPWKWKEINIGKNVVKAETELKNYFNMSHAHAFDSGRSALHFALRAMDIKDGDEVLVQAYTCVVVSNAITQTGATPVYVDINDDFNMSVDDLEKKITVKSKVLIIQHTFGLAADLEKLLAIAKKHGLLVIEDCAHAFGAKYGNKLVGTFGDVGMLSFGADKIISCVRGGALITDNHALGNKIKKFKSHFPNPDIVKTLQHLVHLPVFYVGKKLYHIQVGKIFLFLAQRLRLINKIVYDQEKRGESVGFYPSKLANSLAAILLGQIKEADKINKHRQEISDYYEKNINNKSVELPWRGRIAKESACVYLRYPVLCERAEKISAYAKNEGIILGNWYNTVIAPSDIDIKKTMYVAGSCPSAERLANMSLNLPTDRNISEKDAKRICDIINNFKIEEQDGD